MKNNKEIIKVYDLTSDMAVEFGNGDALYNLIINSLKTHDKVVVDFSNVNVVLSSFLNAAIGNLFHNLNREEFEEKVEIIGLPEFSINSLVRVINSAEKKFAKG